MLATILGSRRWVPHYYPAADIPYLPKTLAFGENQHQCTVDYLKHSEIDELRGLFCDAAQRGANVATDEHTDREHLLELLDVSHAFVARSKTTNAVGACLIVQPWLHRAHAPRIARIHVIMAAEFRSAFKSLTRLAERIVVDLDLCFEACFMMVGLSCVKMYTELRDDGYTTSLAVPFACLNAKGEHLTSYIMYKYLSASSKIIPMKDIIAFANSTCKGPEFDQELHYPKHPSVPMQYAFKGGRAVLIRSIGREDAEYLFSIFKHSANAGVGYGYEEIPTLQYYKEHVLPHAYTVILETLDSGQPLAVLQISPSWLNRGQSTPLADLDIILDPGFKGNGMGQELQALGMALVKEAGYNALISDIFESNKPVVTISVHNKFTFIGVLPKTACLRGKGWVDSLFCYRNSEDILSLEQLVAKSKAARL